TRATRAVLGLKSEETKSAPVRACVRCGDCLVACPERLDPYRLFKLLKAGKLDDAINAGLERCTSCGACAYSCRSRIPLVGIFDAARENGKRS
ncbi:MAG: electron transporter RnfC, partial [Spirochaetae bacterium HGW-Spirochaetae-7]